MRRPHVLVLAALALAAATGAGDCAPSADRAGLPPGDPLAGDPFEDEEDEPAELGPGAPWIRPGPDDELGTADDVFVPGVRGDVDLVVRVRPARFDAGFPAPAPLRGPLATAVAEPFGRGLGIAFAVAASDGAPSPPAGRPIVPPYFEGLPILVMAFADLDGDGYVGRTHRDGETRDTELETLELYPIGRRYAVVRHEVAESVLTVGVGGPTGVRIALGAAAVAGPFDNPNLPCAGCHSWPGAAADAVFIPLVDGAEVAPQGAVVTTQLPFVPDTDFDYRSAPRGLVPAHPDARVGVQVEIEMLPDPADPRIGEAFTLPLDGSSPSIDVARAVSGPVRRYGLAAAVDGATWRPVPGRSVRPGVGADGEYAPVEIVDRAELREATPFRVVPLDALGNVATDTRQPPVTLLAEGEVRIVEPDADGDPRREPLRGAGAAGVPIRLAPATGVSRATGALVVESRGAPSRVAFGAVPSSGDLPNDVLLPPELDEPDGPGGRGTGGGDDDD